MKNLLRSLFFLSFVLILVGCKKETYDIQDEISLKYKKTAIINIDGGKIQFNFTKLIEDSRCPTDVDCFWAGQAAFRININGEVDLDLAYGQHTELDEVGIYNNHTIKITNVEIDGGWKRQGIEKYYTITLKVD